MNKKRKTVNIRMWSETRDRLKIASIKKGVTLMQYLDDKSKEKPNSYPQIGQD